MSTCPHEFIVHLTAAVNDHDLEALVALLTHDYVNHTPVHPARNFTDREQVRHNWKAMFAAVPDLSAVVTGQAVTDDTVWTEWAIDGTRHDGAGHHLREVVVFTLTQGQATTARFYLEPLDTSDDDVDTAVDALVQPSRPGERS